MNSFLLLVQAISVAAELATESSPSGLAYQVMVPWMFNPKDSPFPLLIKAEFEKLSRFAHRIAQGLDVAQRRTTFLPD